jgi:hypothetical protein
MVPSRLDRGKKPRKWRKALAPDRRDTRVVFATPHLLDADACVLPAALQGDRPGSGLLFHSPRCPVGEPTAMNSPAGRPPECSDGKLSRQALLGSALALGLTRRLVLAPPGFVLLTPHIVCVQRGRPVGAEARVMLWRCRHRELRRMVTSKAAGEARGQGPVP